MSTIATAAQTADRVDYWIRRHLFYGSHPCQNQNKFAPARDKRIVISAIGQCLKDQIRRPRHADVPAPRCARQGTSNVEKALATH
jgi:hypothetical protein